MNSRACYGDSVARPIHVEFRLDWIIQLARLDKASPERRLNALANLLTALTQRWRADALPISYRDLKLSAKTCRGLSHWIQLRGPAVGDAEARLRSFTTGEVADELVPDGWIRVLLNAQDR
jgi:hypothetical protein